MTTLHFNACLIQLLKQQTFMTSAPIIDYLFFVREKILQWIWFFQIWLQKSRNRSNRTNVIFGRPSRFPRPWTGHCQTDGPVANPFTLFSTRAHRFVQLRSGLRSIPWSERRSELQVHGPNAFAVKIRNRRFQGSRRRCLFILGRRRWAYITINN